MRNFSQMLFKTLFILLLTFQLNGCIGVFIAGAATGTAIATDNRDFNTSNDDQSLRHQIYVNILNDKELKDSNITIASFHRRVLLTGQTKNSILKIKAEKIAKATPNIKKIYNEIVVGEESSLTSKSKDVWITTKVKSKLLSAPGLKSGNIKVITENGTVYLIGVVTKKQATLAEEATRKIYNVKRVVKIFEYLVRENDTPGQ